MDDYPYDCEHPATSPLGAPARFLVRFSSTGLNWCFGYHHEEAVACFEKALAADPNCAMAHWGVAYAAGPNYNFPWELLDPGKAARSPAPMMPPAPPSRWSAASPRRNAR